MADVDLRVLSNDEFVLHFGGKPNEVDAFTFANSILAFSEALREINGQLNPDFSLEISIDALGGGSFRTRLKTKKKKLSALFSEVAKGVVIAVLAAMIYEKLFGDRMQIIVNDDNYIVQHGSDRVILPKSVLRRTASP